MVPWWVSLIETIVCLLRAPPFCRGLKGHQKDTCVMFRCSIRITPGKPRERPRKLASWVSSDQHGARNMDTWLQLGFIPIRSVV